MTVVFAIGRFIVNTFIMAGLIFIAAVVYAMYTSDAELMNAIYCQLNTDGDLGFNACMIMNN